jgi:ubiquitin carboxyl-terminal hydrolase 8
MWSGNGIVTPRKFVFNIQRVASIKNKDIFTGYAQNDMPEFLLFMIDCMHNSLSRGVKMRISGNVENGIDEMAIKCYETLQVAYSKEYSEIMDMYYGLYVSEIISKDGKTRHVMKPESYFILDLPITDGKVLATNIYGCIDLFTQPEFLEGDKVSNTYDIELTRTASFYKAIFAIQNQILKRQQSQNRKESLTLFLQLILTPLPSRRVTSASFPYPAAMRSASSSGCVCVCACMTMLGAFFGGRVVCKVEKERRVTVPASRSVIMSACNKRLDASRA